VGLNFNIYFSMDFLVSFDPLTQIFIFLWEHIKIQRKLFVKIQPTFRSIFFSNFFERDIKLAKKMACLSFWNVSGLFVQANAKKAFDTKLANFVKKHEINPVGRNYTKTKVKFTPSNQYFLNYSISIKPFLTDAASLSNLIVTFDRKPGESHE
jgi:hypothetical protein